jgi:hypothetical protein
VAAAPAAAVAELGVAGLDRAEVTAVALDAAAVEVTAGLVAAAAFSPSPDQSVAPAPR